MINFDDINKAEENINEIFKIRDELIKASPFLVDMKSRLNFYKKTYQQIPGQEQNILSLIDAPVESILGMSPTNLDYGSLTGATGSFYAVTAETRDIIKTSGSESYKLMAEYNELNKTEELIDKVVDIIKQFRNDLLEFEPDVLLMEAGAIENSFLASDIRAFQDIFKGLLKRAWIKTEYKTPPANFPDFNWPRMAEHLGKVGSKKTLKDLQVREAELHQSFTDILKKTMEDDKIKMKEAFTNYIEHLYAIINLIDLNLMK